MIEFKTIYLKDKIKIGENEYEIKFIKITDFIMGDYQTKLLQADTITLNSLQTGDAKINLQVMAEKDLYLFVYTVKKIEGFDEWEQWDFKQKLEFVRRWVEAEPEGFDIAIKKIKKQAGDLLKT